MKTFNIHEAKTHLSRLVDDAVNGEPFIIAKAGKPLVKVTPIAEKPVRRVGFLQGQFDVPDDFNTMMQQDIEEMFHDWPITSPKTRK